ncbi:melanocortin receptor 3-like [Pseudophryne corroboree]|uniref:melanocortin receptor 3-like n=1 Tax=Pseudophryne corroboree TaxID=495146 RepID=UPI003081CEE9
MVPLAVSPDNFGNILLLCFQICLATMIVISNILAFSAIVSSGTFRREMRVLYMMSTCISDFCTGITWYYVGVFDVRDNIPRKNDTKFIAANFVGISYLTILAAQVDRYCAVNFPMWYIHKMTTSKTVGILVAIWSYTFAILISQNVTTSSTALKIQLIGMLVWSLVTYTIMIGLNIKLFLIAKFQLTKMKGTDKDYKKTSLYLIIAVAASFILLWAPVFLRSIVCLLTTVNWCVLTSNICTDVIVILPRINAAVTPLLYINSCSFIKKTLQEKFCNCHSKICM